VPPLEQTVPIDDRLNAAPLTTTSPPRVSLAPLPVARRLAAVALAVVTTVLAIGSQCGLAVMYVNKADPLHAKAQPGAASPQLLAKAK
jgi:hypothetical protein